MTGVRQGLSESVLARLTPLNKVRHDHVMDIRSRWVAHSVNHFDDVSVLAVIDNFFEPAQVTVQVQSQSVAGFRQTFMLEVRELFLEMQKIVRDDIYAENVKVEIVARTMTLDAIIQGGEIPAMGNRNDGVFTPNRKAMRFK